MPSTMKPDAWLVPYPKLQMLQHQIASYALEARNFSRG